MLEGLICRPITRVCEQNHFLLIELFPNIFWFGPRRNQLICFRIRSKQLRAMNNLIQSLLRLSFIPAFRLKTVTFPMKNWNIQSLCYIIAHKISSTTDLNWIRYFQCCSWRKLENSEDVANTWSKIKYVCKCKCLTGTPVY